MTGGEAVMDYLDFDLSIENSASGFEARVLHSPAGNASVEFTLPFSDLELENFYLRVSRPRRGVRRVDSPEMDAVKTVGEKLFNSIFQGEVYGCFRASLQEAQSQGTSLRIRLRLDSGHLSLLPWEYLYHSSAREFLSLSIDTSIVRYLEVPHRPRLQPLPRPIHIAVMISDPVDFPQLEVEKEWGMIQKALAEAQANNLVRLTRIDVASLEELQAHMRREDIHIFHFIGHGTFDERKEDGQLVFEGENQRGVVLSGSYLGTLLYNHRPLRLVVLNACEGARTSAEDPYAGVAQSLVQKGIPAVIAMQFEITDQAALTFTKNFYDSIASGVVLDQALLEARTAIYTQGNDMEWGTPVYFTRSPDGKLFEMPEGQPVRAVPAPSPAPEKAPQKETPRQPWMEAVQKGFQRILPAVSRARGGILWGVVLLLAAALVFVLTRPQEAVLDKNATPSLSFTDPAAMVTASYPAPGASPASVVFAYPSPTSPEEQPAGQGSSTLPAQLPDDAPTRPAEPQKVFGGYRLPWPAGQSMRLTSSVSHDRTSPSKAHYAFDFAVMMSSNPKFFILAAKDGVVKYAVWDNADNNTQKSNYLVLEDTTTNPTTYMLYDILAYNSIPERLRTPGAVVKQGQVVGLAGDTGFSSGNHLHFMVHTNPDSYWGESVDITFVDVEINGGRPRSEADLPYCRDWDECDETQEEYMSSNEPVP